VGESPPPAAKLHGARLQRAALPLAGRTAAPRRAPEHAQGGGGSLGRTAEARLPAEPGAGTLHAGICAGCDPFSRNLERSKGMGGEGESLTFDNLMFEWVRTLVQFPPQRCTGDGSTLMTPPDTRRHGARQGCKTGEPRARRQTPVNQVAMGKTLNVRYPPSSDPTSQSGLRGVVQNGHGPRDHGLPHPWSAPRRGPGGQHDPHATQNEHQERRNPRSALSASGRTESRASPAGRPWGRMAQEANASGKARG
jgi:hypothetical protein